MELKKIKLHGFKSFCKTTELEIHSGLTGIVGPNGCGKSNVLDGLQWVMGETSYKNLRGSEMDDVIFSGTDTSPSRNFAEVSVVMNNTKNDTEEYEIKRRIERNSGSKYFLNAVEKRARDIQIFFADNSLGAHSVAIVKQGQINQIIESKPYERRKIIEEAAGIGGLHHRKHEAQLRLNATKTNIIRINDIISEISTQLSSLRRQSNQAEKFKSIAAQIRNYEKELIYLDWYNVIKKETFYNEEIEKFEDKLNILKSDIDKFSNQEIKLTAEIDPLINEQQIILQKIQDLNSNELNIKNELQYTIEKIKNNNSQITTIENDISKEKENIKDQNIQLNHISQRKINLTKDIENINRIEKTTFKSSEDASNNYKILEEKYNISLSEAIAQRTDKSNIEIFIERLENEISNSNIDIDNLDKELASIESKRKDGNKKKFRISELNNIKNQISEHEKELSKCLATIENASIEEQGLLNQKINLEINNKNLASNQSELEEYINSKQKNHAVINDIQIKSGHEEYISKILEDMEDSSLDSKDDKYWLKSPVHESRNKLPKGATPLSEFISNAPAELSNFINNVGVMNDFDHKKILSELSPGQTIISRDGLQVRWDGLITKRKNLTSKDNILIAKKRLSNIKDSLIKNEQSLSIISSKYNNLSNKTKDLKKSELKLRNTWRSLIDKQNNIQEEINIIEKENIDKDEKIISLNSMKQNIIENIVKSKERIKEYNINLTKMKNVSKLEANIEKIKQEFYNAKTLADIKDTNSQNLLKEKREFQKNLEDTLQDEKSWQNRLKISNQHLLDLEKRYDENIRLRDEINETPEKLSKEKLNIEAEINSLKTVEITLSTKIKDLKDEISGIRDSLKSLESNLIIENEKTIETKVQKENIKEKKRELSDKIKINIGDDFEQFNSNDVPSELNRDVIIDKLSKANRQREQIGAVNLTAEKEYSEIRDRFDHLSKERDDLESATKTLESGIIEIDNEARARLSNSFKKVNDNFKLIFEKLFDGGKAELRLDDAEDILESGLDVIAWPPGKKPQTISLLSGGEQALTVIALIIAVFLENPSPICVLDEVDAPLDDTNIKKFCDLLQELSKDSDTKFIVVTHHPYTMSKMDRLYGVTMANKGESSILSVDLGEAENLIIE